MRDGSIEKDAITRAEAIALLIVNHLEISLKKEEELFPLKLEMG